MKTRIIYWLSVILSTFIISACDNEDKVTIDNDGNYPEISEEFKDKSVIIK